MKEKVGEARRKGHIIGLVPTMGCLHAGHMSLVDRARKECGLTVVSIFINPSQFGPNEDLASYPVRLDEDRARLRSSGVDVLFLPTRETIYPHGYRTYVEVEEITRHLCGKSRPGFFRGVATVVLKLFNIVKPDRAYFGEKDWQQLAVVESLVRDLNLDVTLVRLPIVRDPDGVAVSSRNLYLSPAERVSAAALSGALQSARKKILEGERSGEKIRQHMRELIQKQNGAEIDYISLCDPETFQDREELRGRTLIALAVKVGQARLIDNCLVDAS